MRRIRRRIADRGKSCEMCCLVDGARGGGGDGGWGMGDGRLDCLFAFYYI